MSAVTISPDAQTYLAAVAEELDDLPAADRAELLEDLTLHLSELTDELDERSLETRLGTAASYAAELRAAADLPPRAPGGLALPRRALAVVQRAAAARAVRETRTFLPQLLPGWWVLRGYLVVLLPSLAQVSATRDFPLPAPWGSHPLGMLLVLAAVLLSVALGRRRLPRPLLPVVVVADVVVALLALQVLASAPERLTVHRYRTASATSPFSDSPLVSTHGPVTDVYPFSLDGRPLTDVLLYDQDGRPLETGRQLWWRDHCRRVLAQPKAVGGIPVPQVYPKHYELDPAAVTLSGLPIAPGQCKPAPRPVVPVPTFAPAAAP